MKQILSLIFSLYAIGATAQEAVQNFGNLKIHDTGALGFHYNFINNGNTDDNYGTVGFYNDNVLNISGAFRPVFNDIEIMVANNLYLDVGVRVKNNTNFILGDVITPRNSMDVNLDYLNDSFYSGEDDLRKIDGYSSLTNKQNFTFPIGDEDRLRALTIHADTLISNAKSAYFFESPEDPSTLNTNFITSNRSSDLTSISTYEYWYLDSSVPSQVTLKWDADSNLPTYINDLEYLKIVGWHTENEQWENLGGLNITGNLTSGQLSSELFIPNQYSVITFGNSLKNVVISLGNYILTANGDNKNDFLKIEGIEESPNNELKIFNRWGRMVYTKKNYSDSFIGKANVNQVVEKGENLPDGIYFYIIDLEDLGLKYQGYMYIVH